MPDDGTSVDRMPADTTSAETMSDDTTPDVATRAVHLPDRSEDGIEARITQPLPTTQSQASRNCFQARRAVLLMTDRTEARARLPGEGDPSAAARGRAATILLMANATEPITENERPAVAGAATGVQGPRKATADSRGKETSQGRPPIAPWTEVAASRSRPREAAEDTDDEEAATAAPHGPTRLLPAPNSPRRPARRRWRGPASTKP